MPVRRITATESFAEIDLGERRAREDYATIPGAGWSRARLDGLVTVSRLGRRCWRVRDEIYDRPPGAERPAHRHCPCPDVGRSRGPSYGRWRDRAWVEDHD